MTTGDTHSDQTAVAGPAEPVDETALLQELAEGGLVRFQARVEAGLIPVEIAQKVLEEHLRRRHRSLLGRLLDSKAA